MFKNKVAVVTGGANGIGKCIAEEFRRNGAAVCVIDKAAGDHFVGDISDKSVLERFAEQVIAKHGHIGYYIAPEYRGRGCASQGLKMLIEEVKDSVQEDEIYLRVDRDNPASLKVMLNNGGYIHHKDDTKLYVRIGK